MSEIRYKDCLRINKTQAQWVFELNANMLTTAVLTGSVCMFTIIV